MGNKITKYRPDIPEEKWKDIKWDKFIRDWYEKGESGEIYKNTKFLRYAVQNTKNRIWEVKVTIQDILIYELPKYVWDLITIYDFDLVYLEIKTDLEIQLRDYIYEKMRYHNSKITRYVPNLPKIFWEFIDCDEVFENSEKSMEFFEDQDLTLYIFKNCKKDIKISSYIEELPIEFWEFMACDVIFRSILINGNKNCQDTFRKDVFTAYYEKWKAGVLNLDFLLKDPGLTDMDKHILTNVFKLESCDKQ